MFKKFLKSALFVTTLPIQLAITLSNIPLALVAMRLMGVPLKSATGLMLRSVPLNIKFHKVLCFEGWKPAQELSIREFLPLLEGTVQEIPSVRESEVFWRACVVEALRDEDKKEGEWVEAYCRASLDSDD